MFAVVINRAGSIEGVSHMPVHRTFHRTYSAGLFAALFVILATAPAFAQSAPGEIAVEIVNADRWRANEAIGRLIIKRII